MLIIRDRTTKKVISQSIDYKGLTATTSSAAGFETLTAQVSSDTVQNIDARQAWSGQEAIVLSPYGTVWEGIVEQVKVSASLYSVFAVGKQLSDLSAASLYGVYYDPTFEHWAAHAKNLSNADERPGGQGAAEDMGKLLISLDSGRDYNPDDFFGTLYEGNMVSADSDSDVSGNIHWVQVEYRRRMLGDSITAVDGTFDFIALGLRPQDGVWQVFLDVELDTLDATSQAWSSALNGGIGYERIAFGIRYSGVVAKLEDLGLEEGTVLEIIKLQVSNLPQHPTVNDIIDDIFERAGNRILRHLPPEADTLVLSQPILLTGAQSSGQDAIKLLLSELRHSTGQEWVCGTYEDGNFYLANRRPRTWIISAKDAGEDAVFNASRDEPSVGGNNEGVITHVAASYEDSNGITRLTAQVPTGLLFSVDRLEIIRASDAENAVSEAEARAALLSSKTERGSFVVKDSIRTRGGGSQASSTARAGDWVEVDTIGLSRTISVQDMKRGGIIGTTSYNGDTREITIELQGN